MKTLMHFLLIGAVAFLLVDCGGPRFEDNLAACVGKDLPSKFENIQSYHSGSWDFTIRMAFNVSNDDFESLLINSGVTPVNFENDQNYFEHLRKKAISDFQRLEFKGVELFQEGTFDFYKNNDFDRIRIQIYHNKAEQYVYMICVQV